MKILVAGSTGYVGGRLVPRLLAEGHEVTCLARDPAKLDDRPWVTRVHVRAGDALDERSLLAPLEGIDVAYYLIHSLGSSQEFSVADHNAADNFAKAAKAAGVSKIVYLGGLGNETAALSEHLSSRHRTGAALASAGTPVLEFRAAVIIGSGSVSFEMLRYLTEVLPVMVTPRWVTTRCQPIAISDVVDYLVAGLDTDVSAHAVVQIGGPDVLTYRDMMAAYAELAGLPRRRVIPVPILSPRLSSLWIGVVTPLPVGVARPLVYSLRNEVVVADGGESAAKFDLRPRPFRMALSRAIELSNDQMTPTRWSDATTRPAAPFPGDPAWSGGTLYVDERVVLSTTGPADVFWAFSRIGGDVGYYGFDRAWRVRGLLDSIVGGVGLRRGRRHPEEARTGDTIDFWRVADREEGRRLLLAADMKLPGDAWLEFSVAPMGAASRFTQTAYFRPRGLWGRLYWWALVPLHGPIFSRMARRIVGAAERRRRAGEPVSRAASSRAWREASGRR